MMLYQTSADLSTMLGNVCVTFGGRYKIWRQCFFVHHSLRPCDWLGQLICYSLFVILGSNMSLFFTVPVFALVYKKVLSVSLEENLMKQKNKMPFQLAFLYSLYVHFYTRSDVGSIGRAGRQVNLWLLFPEMASMRPERWRVPFLGCLVPSLSSSVHVSLTRHIRTSAPSLLVHCTSPPFLSRASAKTPRGGNHQMYGMEV